MDEFRSGELVTARVLGFLPGGRVVLQTRKGPVIAWSNLPLVVGREVMGRVEVMDGRIHVRVVARNLGSGGGAEPPPPSKPFSHQGKLFPSEPALLPGLPNGENAPKHRN